MNFTDIKIESTTGWPAVGRYVGEVADYSHPWFETKGIEVYWSDVNDVQGWQKHRVYQDELYQLNWPCHKYHAIWNHEKQQCMACGQKIAISINDSNQNT